MISPVLSAGYRNFYSTHFTSPSPFNLNTSATLRTEGDFFHFPTKIFRRKHYAEVVKCPEYGTNEAEDISSEMSTKSIIVKAAVKASVLPKSYSSPELLSHILYEKYSKGVPLERQAKDFKNLGADISTATLANWVIESSKLYLKPIYEYIHNELLKEKIIHADETVVQVLKEKDRKATTQSRMWVYCNDRIKLYEYKPTRSGQNAAEFLNGYKGYDMRFGASSAFTYLFCLKSADFQLIFSASSLCRLQVCFVRSHSLKTNLYGLGFALSRCVGNNPIASFRAVQPFCCFQHKSYYQASLFAILILKQCLTCHIYAQAD